MTFQVTRFENLLDHRGDYQIALFEYLLSGSMKPEDHKAYRGRRLIKSILFPYVYTDSYDIIKYILNEIIFKDFYEINPQLNIKTFKESYKLWDKVESELEIKLSLDTCYDVLWKGNLRQDDHGHIDYFLSPGHKRFGEGMNSIQEMIVTAYIRGLNMCIASHFNMHGLDEIMDAYQKINELLEILELPPVIPSIAMEIKTKGNNGLKSSHWIIRVFGLDKLSQTELMYVESLSRMLANGSLTATEILDFQDKFNKGYKIINGIVIPECVRQNIFLIAYPAHPVSKRGCDYKTLNTLKDFGYIVDNGQVVDDEEYIKRLYDEGHNLYAIEVTNPSIFLHKHGIGKKYGLAEMGGGDSHSIDSIIGYTIYKKPRNKIESDLDLFELILKKQTSTGFYPGFSRFKTMFNYKKRFLNPYYWSKFFIWWIRERKAKDWNVFEDLERDEAIKSHISRDCKRIVRNNKLNLSKEEAQIIYNYKAGLDFQIDMITPKIKKANKELYKELFEKLSNLSGFIMLKYEYFKGDNYFNFMKYYNIDSRIKSVEKKKKTSEKEKVKLLLMYKQELDELIKDISDQFSQIGSKRLLNELHDLQDDIDKTYDKLIKKRKGVINNLEDDIQDFYSWRDEYLNDLSLEKGIREWVENYIEKQNLST